MSPASRPSKPASSCPASLAARRRLDACGNWIWCGSWTEAGAMTQRRGTEDPSGLGIYPNWGWSWPANRRVLYNRASCDVSGKPWDPTAAGLVERGAAKEVGRQRCPGLQADSPPKDHMGPFIMNAGRRRPHLRSRSAAFADGPFPEFYEPTESPVESAASRQLENPVAKRFTTRWISTARRRGVQHRLHHLSADRALSLLDQEQSDERATGARAFRRNPVELAADLGIKGGDKVKVTSARATTSPRRWSRAASSP
jgi:formate dehydrogenase major subunit